jgi:hypothetical protein
MAATIWERFEHDPRRSENAPLRASDRDRDVIRDVLGTAYAEGRLTRDELDERTDHANAARTLGDLPPLVKDLVTTSTSTRVPMTSDDRHRAAELKYRQQRQQAFGAFLVPTLICWVIWVSVLFGGHGTPFPWPVFVTLGTGIRWFQLLTSRHDTVASIEHSMEKRERRRLEQDARRQRRQLRGPGAE